MLKKILSIRKIGKFNNYSSRGDVSLHDLNIIYSENGRGKTTLATILRSAKNDDNALIVGRRTLGSTGGPYVKLLLDDNSRLIFNNGSWNSNLANMEIFDETFIEENVYSGGSVEVNHKRNLHRFVIGKQGVDLAQSIDELDEASREKAGEIRDKEGEIKKFITGSLKFSEFLLLPPTPDAAVKEKGQEINTLETADQISDKAAFKRLVLPKIPLSEVESLLATSIESVSEEAELKIRKHISNCMDEKGEIWIESGLNYIKNNTCPFCGQSLSASELIGAYRDYFGKIYKNLKDRIVESSKEINQLLSEDALLAVQGKIGSNNELIEFWKEHVPDRFPEIEFEPIREKWQVIRDELNASIRKKGAAPLEVLTLSKTLKDAVQAYDSAMETVEDYNEIVVKANELIETKKIDVEAGDLSQAVIELETLLNRQKRHETDVDSLCTEHLKLSNKKTEIEEKKQKTKEKLDKYNEILVEEYGLIINEHLQKCGAGFTIEELKTTYIGGKPRTDYCIQIDGEQVELGSEETPIGEHCFKNTLGSGDKSALAFSLFISRLKQDPESDLEDKIIVFDDPATSLDANRRSYTGQQILWFAENSKQVIVLTHNLSLAKDIWDHAKRPKPKTLHIIRKNGKYSAIDELDIVEKTKAEYFKNYEALDSFIEEGMRGDVNLRNVARSIRPLLEGYYRMRFPKDFEDKEWLGEIIGKIREAAETDSLSSISSDIDELTDINDYSKKFHHDQNRDYESVPIGEGELETYARRTLALIR